jgi:hypothetical protein
MKRIFACRAVSQSHNKRQMISGVSSFRQRAASRRKVIQAHPSLCRYGRDVKMGCKYFIAAQESAEIIGFCPMV